MLPKNPYLHRVYSDCRADYQHSMPNHQKVRLLNIAENTKSLSLKLLKILDEIVALSFIFTLVNALYQASTTHQS